MRLAFVVPGAIEQLTGGYIFAQHIVAELSARSDSVAVVELEGCFPDADATAERAAAAVLGALSDGAVAVIDGLALLGFADCLARETHRLRLIGFVHHPLADESGLTAHEAARLRAAEKKLLPLFRGILCPSPATARAMRAYGVVEARIAVTPPGTAKPSRLPQRDTERRPLHLLCVATITPRKAHRVLIDALASLDRAAWRLNCIGSTTRDAQCFAELQRAIATHQLDDNVRLLGERPQAQLTPAYDDADLFVLPSFHEGYGMAFAEAMAHGLPIIATTAGAIPDTVPPAAGILVPPNDVPALAAALDRVITDRALLAQLGAGARRQAGALPDWPQAVAAWRDAVARLAA